MKIKEKEKANQIDSNNLRFRNSINFDQKGGGLLLFILNNFLESDLLQRLTPKNQLSFPEIKDFNDYGVVNKFNFDSKNKSEKPLIHAKTFYSNSNNGPAKNFGSGKSESLAIINRPTNINRPATMMGGRRNKDIFIHNKNENILNSYDVIDGSQESEKNDRQAVENLERWDAEFKLFYGKFKVIR